jgi:exopolysaccharide production protein ExoQ
MGHFDWEGVILMKAKFPRLVRFLEILVVFLVIALVNVHSFARFRQFPEVDNYSDHELDFVFAAILVLLAIAYQIWKNQLGAVFLQSWRHNLPLILFLLYSLASVLWTVYPSATHYKLFFLFFSTISGSYLALRYKVRGMLEVLAWVGGIFAVPSLFAVVFFPFVGVMLNRPFVGAWNGIFWHRNHAGNLFAFFNMVFLFRFLLLGREMLIRRLVHLVFYVSTALLVFGSRSATGIIVFLFLNLATVLAYAWLKFHNHLKPWHYYVSAAFFSTGLLVVAANTAFFFSLLGRSANMTGRIPLWQDLFSTTFLQKPLFGYGYGALWSLKSFRIHTQIRNNWSHQVFFADNGFFDILLNLGLIGLILFLLLYVLSGIRSFNLGVLKKSWINFFPFITFLYVFIGNLTYSFLLEVDQFVWMLLVVMVFATTPPRIDRTAQP